MSLPYTPFVRPPRVLVDGAPRPEALRTTTVPELCAEAGLPCRVSAWRFAPVVLHRGPDHFVDGERRWVGVDPATLGTPEGALRVLEVLAHGFHDYAARESTCGRGLFVAPRRRGRPPRWGRAMSAAERMRRWRRGRRVAGGLR